MTDLKAIRERCEKAQRFWDTNSETRPLQAYRDRASLLELLDEARGELIDGIALIEGDLTGEEWRRACQNWTKHTRALLDRMEDN